MEKIFPNETFGDIIRLPFAIESNEVVLIAVKLESLGEEQSLFPLAQELHNKAASSEAVIKAVESAIRNIKTAEAELEIAREALIRKYEINYLDGRKKYGMRTADNLFPELYSRKTISDIEEDIDEAA